jgi:anti-anti-sigma factor
MTMCNSTASPSLFCIEITGPPLAVALRCAGEIDIGSVEGLERALRASMETGALALEVDLRAVEYLDSQAMKALVGAYRTLVRDGRTLSVRAQPRAVALFQVLGLTDLLNVRPD